MIFLDPSFGREIGGYKTRPVAVVSINDIHRRTRLVTVVPGTTTSSANPNVVKVEASKGSGLRERTFFQCHQVRAIDQGRMTSRAIGRLSRQDLQRIESATALVLGLPLPPEPQVMPHSPPK